MLNSEASPTQIIPRLRSAQVSKWLTKQQALASHFILVAIETDRLMIHAAAKGEWLADLDWGGKRILVTEAENVGLPHEFSGFNNAFAFLDALLMHHSVKTAEIDVESAALAPSPALAG